MKPVTQTWRMTMPWMKQVLLFLGFSAAVVVLLLWLAGKFEKKVPTEVSPPAVITSSDYKTVPVRRMTLSLTETAVGTVRAVHETTIGSKILARVEEVFIRTAGQRVKAGEVLFRLDDSDIKAKLQQAKAAVDSAEAVAVQAEADAKRAAELLPARAISKQDYEKAMSVKQSSAADVVRLTEAYKEVQAALDWATVRAPFDGIVVDKKVDVGDMVVPGQPLTTLYDPQHMQLVASVRDSLAGLLKDDQEIGVKVEGVDKLCQGKVSEIVPESQSASRSFLVKVTGPCPPGIHAGRFGRIYIPLRDEQVLVIPKAAVRNVGQLELVDVVENGKAVKRSIRTGRTNLDNPALGDNVEILSGLQEGEEVVLPKDRTENNFRGAGCQPATRWKMMGDSGRLATCPTLKSGSYFSVDPQTAKPSQEANHG